MIAAAVLIWMFYFHSRTPRNERNAIIQHGTMRRSLLERIGWAEWCITEDAELGLRSLRRGMTRRTSRTATAAE